MAIDQRSEKGGGKSAPPGPDILGRKLAWMLVGALVGFHFVGPFWANSVDPGNNPTLNYLSACATLVGFLLGSAVGGGRVGRFGWPILLCSLAGAGIGSSGYLGREEGDVAALAYAALGAGVGAVLGLALELLPAPSPSSGRALE
jgi:hypothetical protein